MPTKMHRENIEIEFKCFFFSKCSALLISWNVFIRSLPTNSTRFMWFSFLSFFNSFFFFILHFRNPLRWYCKHWICSTLLIQVRHSIRLCAFLFPMLQFAFGATRAEVNWARQARGSNRMMEEEREREGGREKEQAMETHFISHGFLVSLEWLMGIVAAARRPYNTSGHHNHLAAQHQTISVPALHRTGARNPRANAPANRLKITPPFATVASPPYVATAAIVKTRTPFVNLFIIIKVAFCKRVRFNSKSLAKKKCERKETPKSYFN